MDNEEKVYSHIIYFYADTKDEAKTINDGFGLDTAFIEAKKSPKGNYRAKIAVNEKDVCAVACALTLMRKNVLVYEWAKLKETSAERTEERRRYHRAVLYLCDVMLDEEKKTPEEIEESIKNGQFYQNPLVKEYYETISKYLPADTVEKITIGCLEGSVNHFKGIRPVKGETEE